MGLYPALPSLFVLDWAELMNDESLYAHVCLGRLGCSGKNRMDEVLSCAQKKDRHTKSFACLTEWDNEHGVPSGAKLFFLIFCWTWCKCHFSCKLPFLVRFTTELQTLKNELQEALSEALAETVSLWRSNVFPGDFLSLWTLKVWREKTPEPKRWSAWREAQMELQNNCRISMISNFKFLTTFSNPHNLYLIACEVSTSWLVSRAKDETDERIAEAERRASRFEVTEILEFYVFQLAQQTAWGRMSPKNSKPWEMNCWNPKELFLLWFFRRLNQPQNFRRW